MQDLCICKAASGFGAPIFLDKQINKNVAVERSSKETKGWGKPPLEQFLQTKPWLLTEIYMWIQIFVFVSQTNKVLEGYTFDWF